ncbi:MAG: PAS domain-containing protein, partial [Desulfobacteraceae bacterium]|nr:PAS domain-containing protein [Desulfobacteraceae bacterium]
ALTIGILISDWAAQRVTKPLDTLVKASIEVAKGNLEQNIAINTNDEVQILASNFSFMIEEILSQKQKLENQLIEIKQLQQYTEKILDTMNDGLLIIDMDGNINTANPAACSILGVPDNQQLEDNHVLKCFNKELSFTNYIQKSLENPSGRNQHEINIKTGEGTRTILAGTSLLESDQKIPKQIIFNLNDISSFKKLEAEIRQTQRLADLGIFAAGMAHEIRNPLSAIKTYVALLPKKIDNPGFLEKFQRTVPREINRLNIFIEELLELSREPKYNFKLTDIQKLILHCTELVEADFQTKNIDCKFDDLNDLPSVMADADQLEKIFINLMLNAAQAMPNGGVLTINTLSNENMVIIDFKDTGLGFSSEVAENIFNPFFTTKAKGTGLGLAISHKVISEHGGNIKAESELEKGSCFSVRLPIERQ